MLNHRTREMDYMNTGSAIGGSKGALLLSPNGIPEKLTRLDDDVSIYDNYSQYKRVTSIARLAARGLPVLEGFVTRTLNEEVLNYLEYWMRERCMERLTLLFDGTKTGDLTGLIAANPTLEEVQHMGYLLHDSVVAIIMEGNDQFQQGHSVLTSFSEDHILCEVVGPGFEVNDLARGHISPHERFVFRRKDRNDESYRDLGPTDLIDHFFMEEEAYRQSVKIRFSKIHDMISKGPGHAVSISFLTQAQRQCVQALLEDRSSKLLKHRSRYTPINYERLRELYGYISELDVFYSDEVKEKIVEASFLKKQGLVFWGMFSGK